LAAVSNATDKRKDLDIKILAPTGKAAQEASEASGLKASTIDSFLLQKPSSSNKQKVYIVDETSMLDSQKANELLKRARREKAQVIFVGDQKQLKSIGSGDFFSQIQEHVKSVDITEANRFKTDLQKQVAKLANNKELDKALDLLDSHNKVVHLDTSKLNSNTLSIEEIKDHKKIELAKEVSKIVSQNYKEINAYAADNSQVEKINLQVRKDIGFSDKETIHIDTLKPKSNMSQAENKAIAANYEKGDIIQLNRSVKGMKKFAEYEVKEIDTKTNKLTLEAKFSDQNGSSKIHSVTVDARELLSASISEKNKLDIAQGEKIVITRNNKELGINNGDIGFVKSFDRDKKELTVSFDKKEVTINTTEFKNLNYAYATSVHKGQGASVEKAVLVLDSDNALQNKYNLGEVGMTRQKNDLIVITDNLETVKEQLKTEQTKTSTLKKSETKNDNLSLAS
jgi:ATP-dependent exoDNAse (exonuclease V) alpha subunit